MCIIQGVSGECTLLQENVPWLKLHNQKYLYPNFKSLFPVNCYCKGIFFICIIQVVSGECALYRVFQMNVPCLRRTLLGLNYITKYTCIRIWIVYIRWIVIVKEFFFICIIQVVSRECALYRVSQVNVPCFRRTFVGLNYITKNTYIQIWKVYFRWIVIVKDFFIFIIQGVSGECALYRVYQENVPCFRRTFLGLNYITKNTYIRIWKVYFRWIVIVKDFFHLHYTGCFRWMCIIQSVSGEYLASGERSFA